jgi:ribosome-associated protein
MEPKKLADEICSIISAKKGEDILLIDVSAKTTLADYFIIASGKSTTQVRSLCDSIDEKLSKEGIEQKRREGVNEGRWAAMDYGDVIVHIFNDEQRLFYHLERLWGDNDNIVKIDD